MTFEQMIEGLQILAKYEPNGLKTGLNGADHDVIWATSAKVDHLAGSPLHDTRISQDDEMRLEELGWFIASEFAEDTWTHFC